MPIKAIAHTLQRSFSRKKVTCDAPLTAVTPSAQPPASPVPSNNTDSTESVNPDDLLNGIGPYQFIGVLGKGKFSRVMRAKHIETGKMVAVKVIDKQTHIKRIMTRLVREVHLLESLEHPNIIMLVETFETSDSLFLVMEYVPGMNLDQYLQSKGGTLTEDEARPLFRQMVCAVDYCHRRWVVHRDLKTANVLVTPEGTVKLADFGLGNRFGLHRLKTICGSMVYYSPEIITGQKYMGPEVDCWCLGITLFRMLVGREPFSHTRTVGELRKAICNSEYTMPDTLSAEVQATIRKCLQLDRRRRMTVRLALQNDTWLTASGQLPCLFLDTEKTAYDVMAEANLAEADQKQDTTASLTAQQQRIDREWQARRQFLKDVHQDKTTASRVCRTVVYHPIHAAMYYTADASSQTSMPNVLPQQQQQETVHIEILRSELFQAIRVEARRLGLQSVRRWDNPLKRLSVQSLRRPLNNKKKHVREGPRRVGSLAELMFGQDKVFYLIGSHPERRSPSPSLSSQSTTTLSFSSQLVDLQAKDDPEIMQAIVMLIQHTCQLMGVSYTQTSATRLLCVLTLRDTYKTSDTPTSAGPIRRGSERSRASSRTTSTDRLSQDPVIATFVDQPQQHHQQHHHPHSTRHSLLPRFSHLTSSVATSFFAKTRQRPSTDDLRQDPDHDHPSLPAQRLLNNKDGIALFTIDLDCQRKADGMVMCIRFVKQQGSSTVFKMARGWITGVLAQLSHAHTL